MTGETLSGKGFSLKDALFNETSVRWLAGRFAAADPGFAADDLVAGVMARLPALELKGRIALIAGELERHLPADFAAAATVIATALPPPLDPDRTDDDFGDFILAPLGEYVARRGIGADGRDRALALLRQITMRFSMEDAIRAFLRRWPDETMAMLAVWAGDANYHVRRLVSEGTRPRLPWSGRTGLPVDAGLPLLDRLHGDRTRYVTRSVANHLNDIAKDAPDLAVAAVARWRALGIQAPDELDWMARHALRTLVKQGHPGAMAVLGLGQDHGASVALTVAPGRIRPGDAVDIAVRLQAGRAGRLLVDYAIGFVKADGSLRERVFKLRTVDLPAGGEATLTRRHRLLADATTYRLYPGRHRVRVQVNGVPGPEAWFDIAASSGIAADPEGGL
jgi:3-methyladenine DNA glycosylase AlkC